MKRLLIATLFIFRLIPLYSQYGGYNILNGSVYLGNNFSQGIFSDITYNDGNIISSASATVHFIGSAPNTQHQILANTGGATATQIGNAFLENGTGGLFINNFSTGLEIIADFNFYNQNGQVTTLRDPGSVTNNNLHIDANAVILGGNATNNVNGYLKKDGDAAAFDFPLSDGAFYGPMLVGAFGSGNSITAAYYHSSPAAAGNFEKGPFPLNVVSPAYLTVSSTEYWNVITNGSPDASLSLTFQGDYSSASRSTIFILGWNISTGRWEQIPNGTPTGLTPGNTISSNSNVNYSDYSAFTIGFIIPPIITALSSPENCNLKNASITATGQQGVPPYQYSLDGITFQSSNIFTGLDSGNYIITLQDSFGLKSTVNIQVKNIAPGKVFAGNDTSIAINQPLQLSAVDIGGAGYTQFIWSPPYGLNDPSLQNPIATVDKNITYTVTALTAARCEATAEITLKVYPGPEIYVPNAFTPNRDGKNDILRAIPIGLKTFRYFAIYNRWGARIFYTTNASIGWDGNIGNLPQNANTFVWVAEGTDAGGRNIVRKGTVVLIR